MSKKSGGWVKAGINDRFYFATSFKFGDLYKLNIRRNLFVLKYESRGKGVRFFLKFESFDSNYVEIELTDAENLLDIVRNPVGTENDEH